MNSTDKIKQQGIDAKRDSAPKVSVFDIFIPTDGPLAHPRANDPLDEDLVLDIMAQGEVIEPVDVRRDGMIAGKLRLTLIDGSRRTNHLLEAVRRWQAAGTFRDEQKYIRIRYFVGDDKAALLHRLRKNTDPLKKPDAPSVLAKTAMQLDRAKATPEKILAVMPRSVSSKSELAALLRWPDLTPEAAALFDDGTVSLGILGAVLDVARDEQAAVARELAEAGMTHMKGATRYINRKRTQDAFAAVEVQSDPKQGETMHTLSEETAKPPTAKPTGQKVHPKTIERIAHKVERSIDTVEVTQRSIVDAHNEGDEDLVGHLHTMTSAARAEGFVLACRVMLGKVSIESLPEDLRATVLDAMTEKANGGK